MPEVVYLAHSVSGDPVGNAARARRWLRWLMDAEPDIAFCVPWLPFVDVCADDNPAERKRCLRDDIAIAKRCDGIALVGGRVSEVMQLEMEAVIGGGGWVVDLTGLGAAPSEVLGRRPLAPESRMVKLFSPRGHVFAYSLLRPGTCIRCDQSETDPIHNVEA